MMVHGAGKPETDPAGATPTLPAMLLTPTQLMAVLPSTANSSAVPNDGPTEAGDVTLTDAKPARLPLLALIVLGNAPGVTPAVKTPVMLSTDPP